MTIGIHLLESKTTDSLQHLEKLMLKTVALDQQEQERREAPPALINPSRYGLSTLSTAVLPVPARVAVIVTGF